MRDQRAYWDREAGRKTFTHPLDPDWLDTFIPQAARVLDYGCGYGRSLAELVSLGYSDVVGMDPSPAMVERGRRTFPGLDLRVIEALPTAEADASFDAVLLLAVLTCIPGDRDQDAVMGEVRRLLRPGGTLLLHFAVPGPDGIHQRHAAAGGRPQPCPLRAGCAALRRLRRIRDGRRRHRAAPRRAEAGRAHGRLRGDCDHEHLDQHHERSRGHGGTGVGAHRPAGRPRPSGRPERCNARLSDAAR